MKKIVFIVISLFLIVVLAYSIINLNDVKNKNKSLKEDIINIKKEIDKEKENSTNNNETLDTLTDESTPKLEELEIWQKAVKKLETALQ